MSGLIVGIDTGNSCHFAQGVYVKYTPQTVKEGMFSQVESILFCIEEDIMKKNAVMDEKKEEKP